MKNFGRYISLNNGSKEYLIAGIFALLITTSLLTYHFAVFRLPSEGYTSISLLDSEKKAINYPEKIAANKNEVFEVYFEVENLREKSFLFQVRIIKTETVEVVSPLNIEPAKVFVETVTSKEKWLNQVLLDIDQKGSFKIFFELWIFNENMEVFEFTEKFCMLKIQVSQIN